MIEIGGKPILWHIMKMYSAHGINEFIICCGYMGYVIKEYFANYFLHMSDITFDMASNRMEVHQNSAEPWRVTLVDTGEESQTGGRLKRVAAYLGSDPFCFTYGDGLSNVDIRKAIAEFETSGALGLVTAVQPAGRFGIMNMDAGRVVSFEEKPRGDGNWTNGGFFVLRTEALDYIDGDQTVWESEALPRLARDGKLVAHFHDGFWHPMDTLRDKVNLEEMWRGGRAPWKIWQ
jgi:glucose-1-phosphate cytidylyltransferase